MTCSDEQDPIELIARARDGSNGALGSLLEMYRRYLTLLARIQLGDRLRANVGPSDVVQETFLRAQRGFVEFHGQCEAEIMTWLRRILARTLANQLRHYQDTAKRDVNREQNLHDALGHSSEQVGLAVVAREFSPSAEAQRREQVVLVADALEQLPEHYRDVIVLRNFQDLPFSEVASRMGRSVDSVMHLWPRALAGLRQQLSELS
jgi:RNA polymerase sigma-70 factor (ECF subfamily)